MHSLVAGGGGGGCVGGGGGGGAGGPGTMYYRINCLNNLASYNKK